MVVKILCKLALHPREVQDLAAKEGKKSLFVHAMALPFPAGKAAQSQDFRWILVRGHTQRRAEGLVGQVSGKKCSGSMQEPLPMWAHFVKLPATIARLPCARWTQPSDLHAL